MEELLEKHGWTLECRSPLEIRYDETNDVATGIAALIVIEYLRESEDE